MLVLSRKLNQEIMIGENVKVTVLKIKGNTVRLGIEAPREVRVIRGELPQQVNDQPAMEAEPKMAEVTIVFSDPKDKPVDESSFSVVPFRRTSIERKPMGEQKTQARKPDSVREPLPQSLSNNRLQEILADLSGQ